MKGKSHYGKKEKQRKLRVDKKIQKNNKLLYIIGLIIVCIALFFSVNYYLSRNYVYNIPFTNLDVNGNNPIINANLNNVGNVYYVNNNKLEKIDDNNKIEALKILLQHNVLESIYHYLLDILE